MTKAKAAATDVVVSSQTSTAIATTEYDDVFADYAGAGLENVKASDLLIPRISILQDLSPQVKEEKPEYIEGAKRGMICDIGTGQLLGDTFIFVPVHYAKVWLEWFPRKSGKGLAAIHHDPEILNQCTQNEKGQPFLPNGNYIAETSQLFGLDLTGGACRQVFVPFASTQIKKAKKLLNMALAERIEVKGREFTPPLFYRSYIMSTVGESNSEGDWFGWKIERGPAVRDMEHAGRIVREAMKMREMIDGGLLKADMSAEEALDASSAARYAEEGKM